MGEFRYAAATSSSLNLEAGWTCTVSLCRCQLICFGKNIDTLLYCSGQTETSGSVCWEHATNSLAANHVADDCRGTFLSLAPA